MKAIGVLLIVLGIAGLAWGGIDYTKREKVIDVGPIQATVDHEKHVPLPPVAGVGALIAGVLLVVLPRRGQAA